MITFMVKPHNSLHLACYYMYSLCSCLQSRHICFSKYSPWLFRHMIAWLKFTCYTCLSLLWYLWASKLLCIYIYMMRLRPGIFFPDTQHLVLKEDWQNQTYIYLLKLFLQKETWTGRVWWFLMCISGTSYRYRKV